MKTLSDFKKFILRGNVLDLAVALVVGNAFNAVVMSFANDVIMGLVGALFGKPKPAHEQVAGEVSCANQTGRHPGWFSIQLEVMKGTEPKKQETAVMDAYLVLLSEHGMNASTFSARVTTSTLSDMYSAITTAISHQRPRTSLRKMCSA